MIRKWSRRRLLLLTLAGAAWPGRAGAAPALQPLIDRYLASLPAGYGARAVLQAQATWQADRIVLAGRALEERDRRALEAALAQLAPVENRMEVFPYSALGERAWAVVHAPGADLRAAPDSGSELVSQALAGDTLKLLEVAENRRWFKALREWDGYVGWLEAAKLTTWTAQQYQDWQAAPKAMLLRPEPGLARASVVRLGTTSGDRVRPVGITGLQVTSAEGKSFTVAAGALRPLAATDLRRERLVELARQLLADQPTRYLWGGTIDRALDCSGFNQTVYRLAGLAIPRDSYQQQAFARPIAPRVEDWRQLQPGDLLFFSEKRKRATHTGIYVGDGRFIHSSSHNKGIAENHLLGESDYERFLRQIYFGSGRIL